MRLGVIIFTGIAFVAGGITAPATNAVSPPHVLFGAWVQQGSAPTHADAVRALEARLGFTLGVDNHYRPWTNTFWRDEQDDIASGRTPMVSWTARGTTAAAIASGSQDATIARVADAVKALKSRVLVRFAYEMDQPKSGPRYLGSPSDFIAAWRHVYAVFQARGATNAKFVWAPIAVTVHVLPLMVLSNLVPMTISGVGVREWASVQDMASAAATVVRLAEEWAR